MPTGFIYVVTTVTQNYTQSEFCNVPTEWEDRLYFGPRKRPMRPRMNKDDYIFGLSPSQTSPRHILFATRIEEWTTFAEAHRSFPDLHGPQGPIHVCPVQGTGAFPRSDYQHIPGSSHSGEWEGDLASVDLDRFFVCQKADGWRGRWLGPCGPQLNGEVMAFLKKCDVYGAQGHLGRNNSGTLGHPIAYGQLYTGLHLETDKPEQLLELCAARMNFSDLEARLSAVWIPLPSPSAPSNCGTKRSGC